MLDGIQLELNVQTIQPGEAYLLYTDVSESWDSTYEFDRGGHDDDYLGFGPGRYETREVRAYNHNKTLTGVVTDDCTLDIVKGRMDDYARQWEEKARAEHGSSIDRPNYEIKIVYSLEKVRHVVLGAS